MGDCRESRINNRDYENEKENKALYVNQGRFFISVPLPLSLIDHSVFPTLRVVLDFHVPWRRIQSMSLKVPAVNETWLKRCDHGQFFVKKPIKEESIPYTTVFHDLDDTYAQLFYKSIFTFYYAYVEISSEFDWYLKSDDDNYIIMEHLREFLSGCDPQKPLYLGYEWRVRGNYHSGGSGYILLRTAVKKFVQEAYRNRTLCPYNVYKDVAIGTCLRSIGINTTTTPESMKRFMPLNNIPAIVLEVICLHYQNPDQMRRIETFLYKVDNPRLSNFYKS